MIEWKNYFDKDGYQYLYTNIDMLCGQLTCMDCPHYNKCSRNEEQDGCEDYNNKLEELKKEGVK